MDRLRAVVLGHKGYLLLAVILLALPVFTMQEGYVRGDVFSYMVLGQRIRAGEGYVAGPEDFVSESHLRGPVYATLLSASFCLFGSSINSALLVSKIVFLCCVIVGYLLATKLYEWRTGLLLTILIVTASYLVGLNAHLEIDPVMAFFMLLGLYLAVLSLEKVRIGLGLLSGFTMALGFLTKEIALLWLPLPVYLFLSIPQFRHRQSLLSLAGYALGFGATTGAWWLYFYLETGEIFLASRVSLANFVVRALPWLLMLSVLMWALIYLAYRLHDRLKRSQPGRRVIAVATSAATWLLWLICTVFLALALAQQSAWFYSIAEIPVRLWGFKEWWELQVIPQQPLFSYSILIPAGLIFLAHTLRRREAGDRVVVWSILALMPQALTLSMPGQYIQVDRYGIAFFWLGYILLARAGILILQGIGRVLSRLSRSAWRLSPIALVVLVVWGVIAGWAIPRTYDYWSIRPRYAFNNEAVRQVSKWLEAHVPAGSVIASSAQYIDAWYFYSNGAYNTYRWYSFNKADRSDRVWPLVPYTYLTLASDGLRLYDIRFPDQEIPSLAYIQHAKTRSVQQGTVPTSRNRCYTSISAEALVDTFRDLEIEYLIISTTPTDDRYMLNVIPGLFTDHPAFETRFSVSWPEGRDEYGILVLQVDRSKLEEMAYPVVVTASAWPVLVEDAKSLLGEEYDLYDLIQALNSGPIAFRPASSANLLAYRDIADAYMAHGDIDLAAFEYHLAVQEAPQESSRLEQVTQELRENYPGQRGTWLVVGDLYYQRGEYDQALQAYLHALSLPESKEIVSSAINHGLGNAYLAAGDEVQAAQHFRLGLSQNLFQATEMRLPLLISEVNALLAEPDLARAIALVSAYRATADGEMRSDHDPAVAVDLVSKWADANIQRSEGMEAGVRMFVVRGEPHFVLFAHPPTDISYVLQVPANAYLEFVPTLAEAVWQLGKGDGVQFEVYIEKSSSRTLAFSSYIDPKNVIEQREWKPEKVDLAPWSNQTVTISFVTTSGPNNDELFDWAAWGEPRIVQRVAYDLLELSPQESTAGLEIEQTRILTQTINHQPRPVLYAHPIARAVYSVMLPVKSSLHFGYGMDPAVWSPDKGDGVEYNIYVSLVEEPFRLHRVFHRTIDPKNNPDDRRWFDERLDLSRFGGQAVKIIFEALPGPAGDDSYDWGGWSWPVLVDDTLPDATRTGASGTVGTP